MLPPKKATPEAYSQHKVEYKRDVVTENVGGIFESSFHCKHGIKSKMAETMRINGSEEVAPAKVDSCF